MEKAGPDENEDRSSLPPSAIAAVDEALSLLGDVSSLLAVEPDPGQALTVVLQRLIPGVADWGVVRMREPGSLRPGTAVHGDPTRASLIDALLRSERFDDREAGDGTERVNGDHRAHILDSIDDGLLDRLAPNPDVRQSWRELGVSAAAVVPLVAGGRVLGSIVLAMGESARRFDRNSIRLVESFAPQCALLVENTRLVREAQTATLERVGVRSLLDTVLANAPMATVILGTDLRVVHANDAFAAVAATGAEPGATLAEALPDLASSVVAAATGALAEGTLTDRAVVRSATPDEGKGRLWLLSAFPIDRSPGERSGVGLFLSDITSNREVARRLTESLARLDLSLAAGSLASWDWDFTTNTVVWSGNPSEALGLAPEAFGPAPTDFLVAIHPEDRDQLRTDIIEGARAAGDVQNEVRVIRPDGEVRSVEIRGRVISDTRGIPRRMIGVAVDSTDRRLVEEIKARLLERERAARLEAEEARERLALLAEVSAALTSTLDPQAAYDLIPRLVVPRLGDWCVVDALDESGSLREVAIAHRDPQSVDDVRALRVRRQAGGGDGIWSVRRTVRQATSELVMDIDDGDLSAAAVDAGHLALLRRLAPRSAIVVPLVARGRVLGGLTLVVSHDRRFQPDDLTLVENVAGRAAMAVDNALLFESRAQVARALQQTLLPPVLPKLPHVDLVSRYRVADGGIDIGGDFYDLFELADGSSVLVIGDVCGKGPAAAAVTGLFRHTLRAVALNEHSPAAVLRGTNDAILGQIEDNRFCTAALVKLETTVGRVRATIACGGHPRPLVVRASGTVEPVEVSGTLLGVLPQPVLRDVKVELGAGDSLVLYTDGVTEARGPDDLFGEARLVEVLTTAVRSGVDTAAGLADEIIAAVDRFQRDDVANDDTAILVLRVDPPA